ncbi:MAG TPA: amidohydrolase family protein [Phycisphaeraceae bacterium]
MSIAQTAGTRPLNPANRLGLDYRQEARLLPWRGPIWDVHTHINSVEAARLFFEVARLYGVERVWSMTPLEQLDAITAEFGDRIAFIAVPNYAARDKAKAYGPDWLNRIERFAEKGVKICKFWAAPRGRDFFPEGAALDAPNRLEAMRLAHRLGMMFMTHVGDPDTWFATHYQDAGKYGTKLEQYEPLERLLDEFGGVPWIAAHMGGWPERLDFLQGLLDRHPNLHLDTSATKWMVRELSKQPGEFADFCRRNAGRVLFGSDIVATTENRDFDLYASRYWALRTLMETDYDGLSPIVDPDLPLIDPALPDHATARLRGAHLDDQTLSWLYHEAAHRLLNG